MIAYVFWHARERNFDAPTYEATLLRFHAELATAQIEGFISSQSFAVSGTPWVREPHAYEDWYLLADSCALDRLNDAAVRARARGPHDALAAASIFGDAGLYRLWAGPPGCSASHAAWFSKPQGMAYGEAYERIARAAGGASAWQRQMVLGPSREFCLLSERPVELPAPFEPILVSRRLVL